MLGKRNIYSGLLTALLLVGYLLISTDLEAQLRIEKKNYSYGPIDNWNNPAAVWVVTNTSKEDITFLPTFPTRDLKVSLPKEKLKSGESTEITARYYTEKKGPFLRNFEFYIDKREKPYKLSLSGNIRSIAYNAYTSCPSDLSEGQQGPVNAKVEFRVIESETHIPVPQARIDFFRGTDNTDFTFTRLNGQTSHDLEVGLYTIKVSKEGYRAAFKPNQYLNRNTDLVVVTLERDTAAIQEDSPIFSSSEKRDSIDMLMNIFDRIPSKERKVEDLPDYSSDGLLSEAKYLPNNIVFLIDVSNSMKARTKLPLLKTSIKELVSVMRESDKICIITYSSSVNVMLPSTNVEDKEGIYELIDGLQASGITRGKEALNRAYENLALAYIRDANNQLMLATDGKFTELANSESELYQLVRENSAMDRKISVIGFGQEGTDRFMRNLARNGGGDYIKISKEADVNELLIREVMTRSLNNKP